MLEGFEDVGYFFQLTLCKVEDGLDGLYGLARFAIHVNLQISAETTHELATRRLN